MANITYHDNGIITVSITLDLQGSLIEMENATLDAANDISCLATGAALKRFDLSSERALSGPRKGKMRRNIKRLTA